MKYIILAIAIYVAVMASSAEAAEGGRQKVLIVYYSYSGNTKTVAEKLQAKTGADIFRIETVRAYPSVYKELTDEAKRELKENDLPALKGDLPDMASYDLILVGGPVWWYTVATPVMSFLRQADFAGKKTAAFCTHGGGIGQYFPHFKEQAKNAIVLEGLPLRGSNAGNAATDKALDAWLAKLR